MKSYEIKWKQGDCPTQSIAVKLDDTELTKLKTSLNSLKDYVDVRKFHVAPLQRVVSETSVHDYAGARTALAAELGCSQLP